MIFVQVVCRHEKHLPQPHDKDHHHNEDDESMRAHHENEDDESFRSHHEDEDDHEHDDYDKDGGDDKHKHKKDGDSGMLKSDSSMMKHMMDKMQRLKKQGLFGK